MSHHPTRALLEGFRRGKLSRGEMRLVLPHLMQGCDRCRRALAELARASRRGRAGKLSPDLDAAYDAAFSAAFRTVRARARDLDRERAEAGLRAEDLLRLAAGTAGSGTAGPARAASGPGFWTWGVCEALIERCRALSHEDPAAMIRAAELARLAAEGVDPDRCGHAAAADLQALAAVELSNAYRVADDLGRAERALLAALERRRRGSGDPLLLARVADLAASLRGTQRRFAEAFRLLDVAHDLYASLGDSHRAGRALIKKGLYTGHANDPHGAIRLLARGLAAIDRARDPRLVFHTLHNLIDFLVEVGECREARLQLWKMRRIYRARGERLMDVRLRWLEGQIALGLGELERAERDLAAARGDLAAAGLPYQAALAGLDLAKVWIGQARTAEVRPLVDEMVAAFRAVNVEREALGALLTLGEAAGQERATVGLVQLVSGLLRRAERERGSRPEPSVEPPKPH